MILLCLNTESMPSATAEISALPSAPLIFTTPNSAFLATPTSSPTINPATAVP